MLDLLLSGEQHIDTDRTFARMIFRQPRHFASLPGLLNPA